MFVNLQNNRDSVQRAITKFVWLLGRYEPSPPSTKELHAWSFDYEFNTAVIFWVGFEPRIFGVGSDFNVRWVMATDKILNYKLGHSRPISPLPKYSMVKPTEITKIGAIQLVWMGLNQHLPVWQCFWSTSSSSGRRQRPKSFHSGCSCLCKSDQDLGCIGTAWNKEILLKSITQWNIDLRTKINLPIVGK